MALKIEKKIVGYNVVKEDEELAAVAPAAAPKELKSEGNVVHMTEQLERPDMLVGSTYKVKTPLSEHALYITVNDVILNPSTDHELRRPFEIFINSKNMDHFQTNR